MQRSAVTRLGFIAAAAILATACKKEAPAPAAAEPNVVVIIASDFAFAAPDTIPAGMTRFRLVNSGAALHHAQLLKLDSGKTYADMMAAMQVQGPPPAWMKTAGGPNGPRPGSPDTLDLVQDLAPGHYALVCFIPDSLGRPHIALGMSRALEVVPSQSASAPAPAADLEMSLTDYAFTESAPLTAGRHTIKVTNSATQDHEVVFIRLDSGATAQGVANWVKGGMKGRPPVAAPIGGTAALPPNGVAWLTITLEKGTYGLLCFVPDARDGREHTEHGMLKQITVD